jgi:hypothetical protein
VLLGRCRRAQPGGEPAPHHRMEGGESVHRTYHATPVARARGPEQAWDVHCHPAGAPRARETVSTP